jgi:hypothetical protein
MNEHNGAAAVPDADPAATIQAKAQAVLDAAVRQVLGTVIRGLLVSAPGTQPHVLLNTIARVTGALCAGAVQADLQVLFQLRKGFKDAFDEGVKSIKPQAPPAPMPTQRPSHMPPGR